jgi:hypothetical protein
MHGSAVRQQDAPQQSPEQQTEEPPAHCWPAGTQVLVDVVLLEVDELVLLVDDDVLEEEELLLEDEELLEDGGEDVVVDVAHVVPVFMLEANGHPGAQAVPPGQHVNEDPLPQGVVPAGQPHRPRVASWQAMPLLQQRGPHGVAPDGQQHWVAGSEHVCRAAGQQPFPHGVIPDAHVTAPAPRGLNTLAVAAARAVTPMSLSAPRREVAPAIARDSSSNCSLISAPLARTVGPSARRRNSGNPLSLRRL